MRTLFIHRQPPFGSAYARESLDALLAAAAFDQPVSLLFMGDGLYQLIAVQQGSAIGQKNLSSALSALELYGVENIYAQQSGLSTRGISTTSLALEPTWLTDDEVGKLINDHQAVMNF